AVLVSHATPAGFRGVARAIPDDLAARMTGTTWHPGCPVHLDDLAVLELTHHAVDGPPTEGHLVVARAVAAEIVHAFATLYEGGFPIERMAPIEVYDGDDDTSMAANNTSAFNCRTVEGTDRW